MHIFSTMYYSKITVTYKIQDILYGIINNLKKNNA